MSRARALDLHASPTDLSDHLAPFGLFPHDRERTVPAFPVALGRCWAAVNNEVSDVVVALRSYLILLRWPYPIGQGVAL